MKRGKRSKFSVPILVKLSQFQCTPVKGVTLPLRAGEFGGDLFDLTIWQGFYQGFEKSKVKVPPILQEWGRAVVTNDWCITLFIFSNSDLDQTDYS